MHAHRRHLTVARFIADHATKRGRPDHRAHRLRADGKRHDAGPDCRRRTARRTAGRMKPVPWIHRRSRFAPGKLGRHRLAEYDTAERLDTVDNPRVLSWPESRVNRRTVGGGHVLGCHQILHADRHACEWLCRSASGLISIRAVDKGLQPGFAFLRAALRRFKSCATSLLIATTRHQPSNE